MKDKKKKKENLKMPQHKKNANVKQSPLDPDKMENEAEHFKDREIDSTSRPSSRESTKTVSSSSSITSGTSEIASMLVSETLDRAAANINELMQSISRWEAEERSKSDKSSAACCTHQKVEWQLQRFFGLRRVFAENKGETQEVTQEDLVTEMDSIPGPSGQEVPKTVTSQNSCDSDRTDERSAGRHASKIYKKMRSTWKRCFRWKPRKKVQLAAEQDLDETVGSEGSDSKSGSPYPEETSPTASICSSEDIRDATKADLSSVPLKLVYNVQHEDVTVQETIHISSTSSLISSSQLVEHHEVRSVVIGENIAEKADLNSVPLEQVNVADKDVAPEGDMEEFMEDNLVTDMDATPEPSLVLLGAQHVDEVVGSASSYSPSQDTNLTKPGSPFPREMSFTVVNVPSQEDNKDVCETFLTVSTQKSCDSDRTDEKSTGRHGSKIYKKMKSALKRCFRKPSEEVQLAADQDLDEAVGSESRDSKSGSPCPEKMSPTASICSSEDIRDATKADLSSVSLELVHNVEHEDVTVQETINISSTSSLTSSSQPVEHHEVRSVVMEENIAEKADLSSVPLEQVNVADKDVAPEGVMEEFMEDNLVTDMDATPEPSLVLSGAKHVDEVVGSASSYSPSQDTNLTKPGFPFPREMSFTEVDAPSQEDNKDVCETFLTVSTQKSCDSDRTDERSAGRHGSKIYKKMKSTWKSCFRRKPKKKVQLAAGQDLDEDVGSESSDSTCGSPCPEDTSPTALKCSSEDIRDATKADLSSDPLELGDNVEHEDITPETEKVPSTLSPTGSSQPVEHREVRSVVMEEDLVTYMDSSPGISGENGHLEHSEVHLGAEQNVDEIIKTASSNLTSGCASPKETSTIASIGSSEDIKASEEADLSSVPLELLDVEDIDVTLEDKEDVDSKPSTTSSSPPAEHHDERSSVTEKDLVMYRDSTPGPSGQDRHLEGSQGDNGAAAVAQLTGLKNTFYTIIKEFFDSLTEEQRREISKGVYNMDVKEKLTDMCAEVLRLVIEMITDILSKAIYQFAPPLTMRSPTSSQVCGTEAVGQKLPSELLRENFDITDDNIQQSLKNSFGEAFCDVVGADTSVSVTPKFTEAIVRTVTDEVNSVLSETIQASVAGGSSNVCAATCCQFSKCKACKEMLAGVIRTMKYLLIGLGTAKKKTIQTVKTQEHSDCESKDDRLEAAHTMKVHKKKLSWWSCFCKCRKNKVQPVSDKRVDEAVRLSSSKLSSGHKCSSSPRATSNTCSVRSSKLNSTPLELVDYAEDEDAMSEETGNAPFSYSIGWFPPACQEDEVIVPDYQESLSLSEIQTEVRSSSCHQSGDFGDGNCQSDVGTEEAVMAASDTNVDETQADKSNRICRIFRKGKKEEDKKASAEDQAVRTKRPSLLKRFHLFCCRLGCCSNDDEE